MRSVRTKFVMLVLFGTILTAGVIGAVSILNTKTQIQEDSTEIMNKACQNSGQEIDAAISRIEQSVQTLADCSLNALDDVNAFQTDPAYVRDFTEKMENTIFSAAANTEGAVTVYLRYNPDFTEPTSGLFLSRNEAGDAFDKLVPTDFSIYEKDDLAHVGWYYIPVENKKSTWMSPYLNENLQVYMISYVIPLYKDGVSIGIVGMDIDFTLLQQIVDRTGIYHTGYSFLTDDSGHIMYHNSLKVNDSIADLEDGMQNMVTALQEEDTADRLIPYHYEGTTKKMAFMTLKNGMKLVLTAPLSEINASANRLIYQILGSTIAAVLVSVLICLFMVRRTVKPIEELNRTARKIAEGDLDVTVSCHSRDEIGALAQSIELTVARLKDYINYIGEISDILDELANGNLVFELHYEYAGEFSKIKESLLHISHSLNRTLSEIHRVSGQVVSGSEQVASGVQSLSQGSAGQAASMQELTGSIHEISEQVSRNAKSAEDANVLAAEAEASVQESSRYMKEMTVAMQNIAGAAEKINQIVKTVDEIASQTNILALNAAVEAARAGAAGKGFAVVADEVRSLASKVAEATRNITELVENADAAILSGTRIVEKTEGSLQVVVEKSNAIGRKIQEITAASEGQANAIEQVNTGIGQISAVVQSTSDAAQEGAAASEQMSLQAQELQELIGQFRTREK